MSVAITYENLHRLWPRGDGAVRMLMYLWKIVCQGYVPNFTDDQLAKRFFRRPATIQRWRARWESKGILITSFRCQRTFYEVNIPALQEAIQSALEAEEARKIEAQARRLEKKTRLFDEIGQKLRSQWAEAHSSSDQNDLSEPIKTGGSTTSIPLNQSFVPGKPGNGLAADDRVGDHPAQALVAEAKPLKLSFHTKQALGKDAQLDSIDLSQDRMRAWLIEAAQHLVEQNGQPWNRNLQKLLDGLETQAILRAVSSLWEQTQKGNVRNAAKFLTRAVQRKYCCTKGWSLPDALPGLPTGVIPSGSPASSAPLFPDWLPGWAVKLLERLMQQGRLLSRYELVDGGLQVWSEVGVQFFPLN